MRIFWTSEFGDSLVIEDDDGTRALVPAGGGDKKHFVGDASLLEPLDVPTTLPGGLRIQLVGVREIALRSGVQPDTVRKWRQRHEDFPPPLVNLAAGPVWSWEAVERWLRTHPATDELESGRRAAPFSRGGQPTPDRPAPSWSPQIASLFTGAADDFRLIAMPQSGADAWPTYIEGYRMAARLVLHRVVRKGSDQDFYVYPLVFLYRQYLELQLKLVVYLGRQLHGGRGRPTTTHSLTALWDAAIEHIARRWPNDATDTSAIRADLAEFDALDRGSYAFRYPVGTSEEPSLPAELQRFNLRAFAQRAEEIGQYLEGASEGLWVHRDWQREMEAEFAP
jgi:hypothetical protein